MACNAPIAAWKVQGEGGGVIMGLKRPQSPADQLALPCGKCTGCKTTKAREWALRCHLEWLEHEQSAFLTLTYDPKRYEPPTLQKRDVQLFWKRLRKTFGPSRPIRHFTSGEYGELSQRPHYHALLFGAGEESRREIEAAWKMGRVGAEQITPARIAYTAGYTQKKIGDHEHTRHERVDPETGEVYYWQPPFLQMSRGGRTGHGIGGGARRHAQVWKDYAVHNGNKIAVPRYYHAAWKATATEEEIEENQAERRLRAQKRVTTLQELTAKEHILIARQALQAAKRGY